MGITHQAGFSESMAVNRLSLKCVELASVDSFHRCAVAAEAWQLRQFLHDRVLASGKAGTGLRSRTGAVTFGTATSGLALASGNTATNAAGLLRAFRG